MKNNYKLSTINYTLLSRHSIRLRNYDYSSSGAYFITICAQNRECLFGEIVDGKMALNGAGRVVEEAWNDLSNHYPHIELDEFQIMPNHFHGIIIIVKNVGAIHELPLQMSIKQRRNMELPKIIGRFKMNSAKQINIMRNAPGRRVWQRNYYEHVIRNEKELNEIREYIRYNPLRWADDEENPGNNG